MSRVVLFTGGSGSNLLARALEAAGVEATHVVAVFDNGGSTGKLRRIADLPAMGDARNRLCALAASATPEQARMRRLFELRFSKRRSEAQLRRELDSLAAGEHRGTRRLADAHRGEVLDALAHGRDALPSDFELAKTSLGNLLILGRHRQARSFVEAIEWAARMLGVTSRVLPVTLRAVHLGSELDGGRWIVGQDSLTSADPRRRGRISRLSFLLDEDSAARPIRQVDVGPHVLDAIAAADAIVFGFGSFYSSVLPHLLVSGVARAVAERPVPRILLVNPTADRETEFMTLAEIVRAVDAHAETAGESLLSHVVHFTGERDLAIPEGDTAFFREAGGRLLVENEPLALEEVAERATRRIVEQLPATSRPPRGARDSAPPVVLFDLDHTLYDYATLRRGATLGALDAFCATPESTCDLLLGLLAPPTTHVLRELGFPDLRRQWNAPELYAWARALDDPRSREAAEGALRTLRTAAGSDRATTPFGTRSRYRSIATAPEFGGTWRETAAAVLRDAHAGDPAFERAAEAFERHLATAARLVPGAEELLEALSRDGVSTAIVTEGDTPVQRMKVEYLGLEDLVPSVVVADATLGVAALCEEIFRESAEGESRQAAAAYDELAAYLTKTPRFYSKLLHSLVAAGVADVEAAVAQPTFLTAAEWHELGSPPVASVGDRYGKDLEPLLDAAPEGATGFRVVQGRYARELPLHEILGRGSPAPAGHFPSLAALSGPLRAWAAADGPPVSRPDGLPDRSILQTFADSAPRLSRAATDTLASLMTELARHR